MERGKKGKRAARVMGAELDPGEKLYAKTYTSRSTSPRQTAYDSSVARENAMIDMIDFKRDMDKLLNIFQKIDEGKLDVQGMFHGLSPIVAKKLIKIAILGESEKNQLDAAKHLLGLAGHSVVAKHALATVDVTQPKEALIAMILGGKEALAKSDIEVIDDAEDSDKAK